MKTNILIIIDIWQIIKLPFESSVSKKNKYTKLFSSSGRHNLYLNNWLRVATRSWEDNFSERGVKLTISA